jgi:DNA-binding XRE family transcriptional regulator
MTPQELKATREMLNMTQEEFGKAVGLSKSSLTAMENGKTPIDTIHINSIRYVIFTRSLKSLLQAMEWLK